MRVCGNTPVDAAYGSRFIGSLSTYDSKIWHADRVEPSTSLDLLSSCPQECGNSDSAGHDRTGRHVPADGTMRQASSGLWSDAPETSSG